MATIATLSHTATKASDFVVSPISTPLPGAARFVGTDVSGALQSLAAAKANGSVDSGSPVFNYSGNGLLNVPVSVSASGKILVQIEFAAGDTSVVDGLRASGISLSRSFAEYGLAEAWVGTGDLSAVSSVRGITRVSLPDQLTSDVGTYLSESAGIAGTLTTRTNNTDGVITVDPVNGIQTSSIIDIYWTGGRRTGVTVTNATGTTVSITGGAGDNLPVLNTAINIDSSLKIQGVLDRFASYGIDGSGIKIGVLSTGDKHYQDAVNSGDIANATIRNAGSTSLAEGTALMEIIHDIAPGAQIYFYGAPTLGDFTAGILDLRGQGVNVIVDDLRFLSDPYFTDGTAALAVRDAVNAGVRYVTSAGNTGITHYQAPASIDQFGFQNWNVGGTDDELLDVLVPAGPRTFDIYFQWSDAWTTPTNNYGFQIYDSGNNLILSDASATALPFRHYLVTYNGAVDTYFRLAVFGASGVSRDLELFVDNVPLGYGWLDSYAANWTADALVAQKAVDGVVAVGTINANDAGNDTTAFYSNQGPSTIYTDFPTQTKIQRRSLDAIGIDAVKTLAGSFGDSEIQSQFFGTSAAAPSVAAIMALMLDAAGASTIDVTGATTRTGNIASGSTTISTISVNTADLAVGMSVTGIGIPAGAKITSILSSTSIAISSAATATSTGVYLSFGALAATATDLGATGYDNTNGSGRANAVEAVYKVFTPAIPDLLSATDTGQFNNDNVTDSTSQTISTSAPRNSFIQLWHNGAVYGTFQLTGSFTGVSWGIGGTLNTTDTWNFRVKSSSTAPDADYSNFSPTLTVYTDSLANSVPAATDLESFTDDGQSSTDNVTSSTAPHFIGNLATAAPAGGTLVTLWIGDSSGNNLVQRGSTTVPSGSTSYHIVSSTLTQGAYTAFVRTQNLASAPSTSYWKSSPALNFYVDSLATVVQPATDLEAFTDDGQFNNDNVTTSTTPHFVGNLTSPAPAGGTLVSLWIGDGSGNNVTLRGSTTVASGTTFYHIVSSTLTEGAYTAFIRAQNVSSAPLNDYYLSSPSLPFWVDSIANVVQPAPDLMPAYDTGVSNTDNVTSNTTPRFSGNVASPAPASGTHVILYVDGSFKDDITVAQGQTYYEVAAVSGLATGAHTVQIRAENVFAAPDASYWLSTPLTIYVDPLASTSSPNNTPTTAPDLSAASDTGASSTDNITTDNTPTFTGNVDSWAAGSYVSLLIDGVVYGNQQLAFGQTAYSITTSTVPAGVHSARIITRLVTSAPAAGYPQSPPLSITIDDGTAPVATVVQCGTGASSRNGSIVQNSTTVSNLSTADLAPGMIISGAGIQAGTTIASIASTTSFVMSSAATAGGVSTLSFAACGMPSVVLINFNKPVFRTPTTDYSDLTLTRADVGSVASGTSATQFNADSSFANLDDYYNGRTVRFTSGTLNGQAGTVLDYVGSTRTFIFNSGTFSATPSAGNTFQIDSTVVSGSIASVTSTSQFNGNSTLSSFNDYYNGRMLKFTSGVLSGQSQKVLDYVGSTRTFYFSSGFTTTPAINDTFTLDNNRIALSTSDALGTTYDSAHWSYSSFFDIQMSSGKYSFSLNSANFLYSVAGNVQSGGAGPSVWAQTDGAYQNGGKAEGPTQSVGVYYDVNDDGFVTSSDGQTIIDLLNLPGGGQPNAATWCASNPCNAPYYDVNNDGLITPSDALTVINYVNNGGNSQPPGFAAAMVGESSTPPAELQPADVTANVKLQVTDLNGTLISSVKAGQQFQLRAFLVLAAPAGVQAFAGYADVQFSSLLVTPANNSADVGLGGGTLAGSRIDEAGRAMYGDGSGLMFTKTFTASKKGTATFAADAADLLGHEIYVTGLNESLPWSQVTFSSTTLTIR